MTNQIPAPGAVRVEYPEADVAHIVMDQPGKSANVLSSAFQKDLERVLDALEHRQAEGRAPSVVVLSSGKPKIFVAGADLNAIVDTPDWSDEQIIRFCNYGQWLYHRLQQGPWTSVAAIRGACVGGGLELALGCDFRVALDDRRTLLGLPETKLGLIPGWAGTVRLPRMMPLDTAFALIAGGRLLPAPEAHALGIVDCLVSDDSLVATAIGFARRPEAVNLRDLRRKQQLGPALTDVADPDSLEKNWHAQIDSCSSIHPFAPGVLARHMIRSAKLDFAQACQSEALAMAGVYRAPPGRGLLNSFFLGEYNRRSPGWDIEPGASQTINRVGVVGCGIMGQAVGHLLADANIPVSLYDSNPEFARCLLAQLPDGLATAVDEVSALSACDLVIETVTEDTAVKQQVLAEISAHIPASALIASNTSTIPVAVLAETVRIPERFCGIHFCHPQLMQLVEIVIGPLSAPATIRSALDFVRRLGKTPVVLRDAPGFVVNRLLMAMIDQSVALLREGHSWVTIDRNMREFGMAGGPFEIIDQIGIDTVVAGGRSMARHGVPHGLPSPLLPRMAKHKQLGKKSGAGFYLYGPENSRTASPKALQLLEDLVNPASPEDPNRIVNGILLALLESATDILDAGIVADLRDIDLCLIRGLGFPAHTGGILFWADQAGPAKISELLAENRTATVLPPAALTRWLESGQFFYPHGTRQSRSAPVNSSV